MIGLRGFGKISLERRNGCIAEKEIANKIELATIRERRFVGPVRIFSSVESCEGDDLEKAR